ncbi:MAG: hypothetical protein U0271_18760 [Polyangiaceae bacterium]
MKRLLGVGLVVGVGLSGCVPPCGVDELEPNDTEAADLGVFSDAESSVELDLSLHDDTDVDVMRFDVIDQGSDGNPEITLNIDSYDAAVEVEVLFQCESGPLLTFSCDGARLRDSGAVGCINQDMGRRTIVLNYDCDSPDIFSDEDNSSVEVRVTKLSNEQVCQPYRFEVFVD